MDNIKGQIPVSQVSEYIIQYVRANFRLHGVVYVSECSGCGAVTVGHEPQPPTCPACGAQISDAYRDVLDSEFDVNKFAVMERQRDDSRDQLIQ